MDRVHVAEGHGTERCPYCHGDIEEARAWVCPGCGTRHHTDCARENGSCTVLGCRRAFAGGGVVPARKPARMLPRGAPRDDFRIGLILTAIGWSIFGGGIALIAGSYTTLADLGGAIWYALPLVVAGPLTVGYALSRARKENRWRT